jgi:predicted peroxiredoxin
VPSPIAAVLATDDPTRLYSGLSVLVSTAVEDVPCLALASFKALEFLLRPLPVAEGDTFALSLEELIETAHELPTLKIYACSASVETLGIGADQVARQLDGVLSTPRFLREAGDARLIFV